MNYLHCTNDGNNSFHYWANFHSLIVERCHFETKKSEISPEQLANSDAIMWTMIIVVTTIGTFLMVALILLERYDGDPRKRSLGNRLLSNNLVTILVNSWIRNAFIVLAR